MPSAIKDRSSNALVDMVRTFDKTRILPADQDIAEAEAVVEEP